VLRESNTKIAPQVKSLVETKNSIHSRHAIFFGERWKMETEAFTASLFSSRELLRGCFGLWLFEDGREQLLLSTGTKREWREKTTS
jgi:hypothetical protein